MSTKYVLRDLETGFYFRSRRVHPETGEMVTESVAEIDRAHRFDEDSLALMAGFEAYGDNNFATIQVES